MPPTDRSEGEFSLQNIEDLLHKKIAHFELLLEALAEKIQTTTDRVYRLIESGEKQTVKLQKSFAQLTRPLVPYVLHIRKHPKPYAIVAGFAGGILVLTYLKKRGLLNFGRLLPAKVLTPEIVESAPIESHLDSDAMLSASRTMGTMSH